MSAAEVIEQIKKLPPEERRKVEAFLHGTSAPKDAAAAMVDKETFERVAKWALEEHRELLSRLAK